MKPSTLSAWMERNGFRKTDAARKLGISRPTLDRYLDGSNGIPVYIALACAAIAYGLPPIE